MGFYYENGQLIEDEEAKKLREQQEKEALLQKAKDLEEQRILDQQVEEEDTARRQELQNEIDNNRVIPDPDAEPETEESGLITREKIIEYGKQVAFQNGWSEAAVNAMPDQEFYNQIVEQYPVLKEEEWTGEPEFADIMQLNYVFQSQQYLYNMPAYVANAFRFKDEAENLDRQGISPVLKDYIFEQSFRSQYIADNPEATDEEVESQLQRIKHNEKQLQSYAVNLLEEGNKATEKAFKENPRLQATAEWLHDQKLRNFESHHLINLFVQALPSLTTSYASGKLGAAVATPLAAMVPDPRGKGVVMLGGYLVGATMAGHIMEGGSYLGMAYDELVQDKEVTWDHAEELIRHRYKLYQEAPEELKKEFFSDPQKINMFNYDSKNDPEGQMAAISSISHKKEDGSEGPGIYDGNLPLHERIMDYDEYRAFQLYNYFTLVPNADGTVNKDYLIQEGLPPMQAVDVAEASAMAYATFSGFVESGGDLLLMGMGDAAFKSLKSSISDKMGLGIFSRVSDRLSEVSKSVPKGSNAFTRGLYSSPEVMYRTIGVNLTEALEEEIQYTMEVGTTVYGPGFIGGDPGWKFKAKLSEEWDYKEATESAAGGFMAGTPFGITDLYGQVRRSTDRNINKQYTQAGDTYEGTYFYAPQTRNENNKFYMEVSHSESEDVVLLEDGTEYRGAIVKKKKGDEVTRINVGGEIVVIDNKDIKDIRSDMNVDRSAITNTSITDEDGNPVQVEFDTWAEAYDAAKIIAKEYHNNWKKEDAWQHKNVVDGEAKLELNKDTGKYEVNIYDSKGRLETRESVHSKKETGANRVLQINERISEITENFKEFGGESVLKDDPVIVKYQEEVNRQIVESGIYDVPELVNHSTIAIKKFMGRRIVGVTRKVQNDVMDTYFPDMDTDGGDTILNIVEELVDNNLWNFQAIGEQEFRDTFDMYFTPDGEQTSEEHLNRMDEIFSPPQDPDDTQVAPDDTQVVPDDTKITPDDTKITPDDKIVPPDTKDDTKIDIDKIPGPEVEEKSIDAMDETELETYIAKQEKIISEAKDKKSAPAIMAQVALDTASKRLSVIKEKKEDVVTELSPIEVLDKQITDTEEDIKYLEDLIKEDKGRVPLMLLSPERRARVQKTQKRLDERKKDLKGLQRKFDIEQQRIEREAAKPTDEVAPREDTDDVKERRVTSFTDDSKEISDEELSLDEIKEDLKEKLEILVNKFKIEGSDVEFSYKIYDTWNEGANALFKKSQGITTPGPARDSKGNIIKVGGWFDSNTNTIVVIADSPDAGKLPFHEFSHPFLASIRKTNPELWNSLWDSVANDLEFYEDYYQRVSVDYPEFDSGSISVMDNEATGERAIAIGKDPDDDFKEEMFAFILEDFATMSYEDKQKKSETFIGKVQSIWNAIVDFILGRKNARTNILASKLDVLTTTFVDLADIIAENENIYTITLEDYESSIGILEVAEDIASAEDVHGRDVESEIINGLSNSDIISHDIISDIVEGMDNEITDYIGKILSIEVDNATGQLHFSSSVIRKYLPKGKSWAKLNKKQRDKVLEKLSVGIKKEYEALVRKYTERIAKKFHVSPKRYSGKKYIAKQDPSKLEFHGEIIQDLQRNYLKLIGIVDSVGTIGLAEKKKDLFELDEGILNELRIVTDIIESQVFFRYSFVDKHLSRLEKDSPDRRIGIDQFPNLGGMQKQGQQMVVVETTDGRSIEGTLQSKDKDYIVIKLSSSTTKRIRTQDVASMQKYRMPSDMSKMVSEWVKDFKKKFPKIKSLLPSEAISSFQHWADNKYPLYSSATTLSQTALSYKNLINIEGVDSKLQSTVTQLEDSDTNLSKAGLAQNSVHRVLLHNGNIYRRGHGLTVGKDGMVGNGFGWYGVLTIPNGTLGSPGDVLLYEYQSDFFPEARKVWDEFSLALDEYKEALGAGEINFDDIPRIITELKSGMKIHDKARNKGEAAVRDNMKYKAPWIATGKPRDNLITVTIPTTVNIDGVDVEILTKPIEIISNSTPDIVMDKIYEALSGLSLKDYSNMGYVHDVDRGVQYSEAEQMLYEGDFFDYPEVAPLRKWIFDRIDENASEWLKGNVQFMTREEYDQDKEREKFYKEPLFYLPYLHRVVDAIMQDVSISPENIANEQKDFEVRNARIEEMVINNKIKPHYEDMMQGAIQKSVFNAFVLKDDSQRKDLYEFLEYIQDSASVYKESLDERILISTFKNIVNNDLNAHIDYKRYPEKHRGSVNENNFYIKKINALYNSSKRAGIDLEIAELSRIVMEGFIVSLEQIQNKIAPRMINSIKGLKEGTKHTKEELDDFHKSIINYQIHDMYWETHGGLREEYDIGLFPTKRIHMKGIISGNLKNFHKKNNLIDTLMKPNGELKNIEIMIKHHDPDDEEASHFEFHDWRLKKVGAQQFLFSNNIIGMRNDAEYRASYASSKYKPWKKKLEHAKFETDEILRLDVFEDYYQDLLRSEYQIYSRVYLENWIYLNRFVIDEVINRTEEMKNYQIYEETDDIVVTWRDPIAIGHTETEVMSVNQAHQMFEMMLVEDVENPNRELTVRIQDLENAFNQWERDRSLELERQTELDAQLSYLLEGRLLAGQGSYKYDEVKKALEWQKNFHQIQIMHSIVHGDAMLGPDGNLYMNTGSAIMLLQRNDDAANIYNSKIENKWQIVRDIFYKTQYNSSAARQRHRNNYEHYAGYKYIQNTRPQGAHASVLLRNALDIFNRGVRGREIVPENFRYSGVHLDILQILAENIQELVGENKITDETAMFFDYTQWPQSANYLRAHSMSWIDAILQYPYDYKFSSTWKSDQFIGGYISQLEKQVVDAVRTPGVARDLASLMNQAIESLGGMMEENPVIQMFQEEITNMKAEVGQKVVTDSGEIKQVLAPWVKQFQHNPAWLKLVDEVIPDSAINVIRSSIMESIATIGDRTEITEVISVLSDTFNFTTADGETVNMLRRSEKIDIKPEVLVVRVKMPNVQQVKELFIFPDFKVLQELTGFNPLKEVWSEVWEKYIDKLQDIDKEQLSRLMTNNFGRELNSASGLIANMELQTLLMEEGGNEVVPATNKDYPRKDSLNDYILLNSLKGNFNFSIDKGFDGPWLKALRSMEKKYKFKVKKVYPSWSNTGLYMIVKTEDTDPNLNPLKLSRIRSSNELEKGQPETFDQFKDIFEEGLFLAPGSHERKTDRQRYFFNFFDNLFERLNKASKGDGVGRHGRVDIDIFMNQMYDIMEKHYAEYIGFYEDWLYDRFKNRKSNIAIADRNGVAYSEAEFGDRYHWLNEASMENIIYDEFEDSREGIQRQSMQGESDEYYTYQDFKRLGPFKGLTQAQFNDLMVASMNETMPVWMTHAKKIIGLNRDFTDKEKTALVRFYVQSFSNIRVNHNNFRIIRDKKVPAPSSDNRQNLELEVKNYEGGVYYFTSHKEAFSYREGKSNPQFEKINLFELSNKEENFNQILHLSGKDIIEVDIKTDKLTNQTTEDWNKKFGFLNSQELEELNYSLMHNGLSAPGEELSEDNDAERYTIMASRGDSDKLFIVKIERQFFYDPDAPSYGRLFRINKDRNWFRKFWASQYKNIPQEQLEAILESVDNMMEVAGDTGEVIREGTVDYLDMAAAVSVYNAYQKVWPQFMKYGAANVLKRLKIPFTPVNYSETMRDFEVTLFDPSKFYVEYDGVRTDLVQNMPVFGNTYIGDGMSMTSRDIFNEYNKSFGLKKGMKFAKTVMYQKEGDDIVMVKHLQTAVRPGMEIKDKDTGETVWRVDKNGNIRDVSNGAQVDVLLTEDEAKVRELFHSRGESVPGGVKLKLNGTSVGMIKYDDKPNKAVKSGVQIYNYQNNEELIDVFNEGYLRQLHNRLERILNAAVVKVSEGGKIISHPGEKIADLLKSINKSEYEDGYGPMILEHVKNGSGLYPQSFPFLNNILQSKGMGPVLQLDGQTGGRYKYRPDITGLKRSVEFEDNIGEVNLPFDEHIRSIYPGPKGDRSSSRLQSDINAWLEDNDVYVKMERFPVTGRGSSMIVRVKSVHSDSKIIEVNPQDAKAYLEMDADGDEVHIEYLGGDRLQVWLDIAKDKDISPISLQKFIKKRISKLNLLDKNDRFNQIANSTVGAQAVGMIANIALSYGIMHNVYDSFEIGAIDAVIRPKKPSDKLRWNVYYDGSMGWEGTVEDFLRIWIQASVDNAEFNLLGEWGFLLRGVGGQPSGQKKIASQLFEIKNKDGEWRNLDLSNHNDKLFFDSFVFPIFQQHINPGRIRNGFEFGKNYSLDDTMIQSNGYLSFVGKDGSNRINGIMNVIDKDGDPLSAFIKMHNIKINIANSRLLPIESIAISPQMKQDQIAARHEIEGFKNSIFDIHDNVHQGAFVESMEELNSQRFLSRYLKKIMDKAKVPEEQRDAYFDNALEEAQNYTESLIKEWYGILKLRNEQGKQLDDNSFDLDDMFRSMVITFEQFYTNSGMAKGRPLSLTTPLARALSTLLFLRGFQGQHKIDTFSVLNIQGQQVVDINVKNPKHIAHASSDYRQSSLLDADLLNVFYEMYNKNIDKYLKGKNAGMLGNLTAWNEIKRRACN